MSEILRQIWADIRRGENIDVFATIFVAISVAVLNLIVVPPPSLIPSLILAVLGVFAFATLVNRYKMDKIIQTLEQTPTVILPGAKIYESWRVKEIQDILLSARSSIALIESWVPDAATLVGHIKDASRQANKRLNVDVYMLDPDKPFGAQRRAEVDGHFDSSNSIWSEKYKQKFQDAVDLLQRRLLDEKRIDLTIYKYPTMPGIRLCVIDDKEFIFSWFPVDGPSSENVCFYLSTNAASNEILLTLNRLRRQLKGVQKLSQKV